MPVPELSGVICSVPGTIVVATDDVELVDEVGEGFGVLAVGDDVGVGVGVGGCTGVGTFTGGGVGGVEVGVGLGFGVGVGVGVGTGVGVFMAIPLTWTSAKSQPLWSSAPAYLLSDV